MENDGHCGAGVICSLEGNGTGHQVASTHCWNIRKQFLLLAALKYKSKCGQRLVQVPTFFAG